MNKTTEALKLAERAIPNLLWAATERDKKNRIRGFDGAIEQAREALAAIREALAEPVKQEPVAYMFNVEVEGKANAVFDTADEAVRFSMHHVYLSSKKTQEAIDTLNQGQVFQYTYGFAGVNIVPVAKRKIAAPVDAKVIRAEALEEAAKVCDSVNNYDNPMTATDCAEAIRGLK